MDFALTIWMVVERSAPGVSVFGFIHGLHVSMCTLAMKRSVNPPERRSGTEDQLERCDYTCLQRSIIGRS